ncbi:MAG: hypothetical protein ACT6FG_08435 [Methanosarcinaceae archaeon]
MCICIFYNVWDPPPAAVLLRRVLQYGLWMLRRWGGEKGIEKEKREVDKMAEHQKMMFEVDTSSLFLALIHL